LHQALLIHQKSRLPTTCLLPTVLSRQYQQPYSSYTESGDMNARIAYTTNRMKREWPLRPLPSPPANRTSERPSEQLGERSHYCASLTPASDLPRRGHTDFLSRFPRLISWYQRVNKGVRAKGERPRVVRLVVTSRAHLTIASRYLGGYDETLLGERGKCDVRDWPSAGPSASATRSATQSVRADAGHPAKWPSRWGGCCRRRRCAVGSWRSMLAR